MYLQPGNFRLETFFYYKLKVNSYHVKKEKGQKNSTPQILETSSIFFSGINLRTGELS